MKLSDLQSGMKMELELFDSVGEPIKHPFISEFEWMNDETTAYIATPIFEGVVYPVVKGSIASVYFIFKEELYTFKAKVLGRELKDNLSVLKIRIESSFEKIQRRQFFRFDCSVPVKFKVINSINPVNNENMPYKKAYTKDLSGGGICILTDEKINLDEIVQFELELEVNNPIEFYGKVVRTSNFEYDESSKLEIGILFKKIQEKEREAIIAYIFREQRKLRKKGLI